MFRIDLCRIKYKECGINTNLEKVREVLAQQRRVCDFWRRDRIACHREKLACLH